jgi:hypothetical protein
MSLHNGEMDIRPMVHRCDLDVANAFDARIYLPKTLYRRVYTEGRIGRFGEFRSTDRTASRSLRQRLEQLLTPSIQ